MTASVQAHLAPLELPTYPVGAPERNPVFFEKRVYQGSSGKVYPVPFIDKVLDTPVPVTYQAAHLENEYIRLVMLPEIGGRVLIGQDKLNGNYDFFYRQDVIKPALVGLAGPWISGGVEFNWPQHHRPGTFMPTDVFIEEESDGARTVWMSEHDPLNRLKGMHGLRLRPGSSLIELRVRLFNRTPLTQTFLWWANIAARVHDQYQSFFPPDVHYVADHAVRAQSSFPIAQNHYYGVPYHERHDANDLSWYKNIPVPTSYMVCETAFGFFGGYDYDAKGGFVHVANRHIAPGKKQWTWGNHPFGYAWDRELTDNGGPYIELMAGVYTDNQPDFSYLAPYETKSFSQYWWPIQKTGPVHAANERAALRLETLASRQLEIAALVSAPVTGARIRLGIGDRTVFETIADLRPGEPFIRNDLRFEGDEAGALLLQLHDRDGCEIISYRPVSVDRAQRNRAVATEPTSPSDTASTDELYLIGEHLELYRHPTREPEPYWNEILSRDPGDARAQVALGRRHLRKGEIAVAAEHFERAIARLTARHPNPATGEAHYHLGLARLWQDRKDDAYTLLYKATWNFDFRSPAYFQLALIDCRRRDWPTALDHCERSLDTNRQNNKAIVLKAAILRLTGKTGEAAETLSRLLATDPLDHWARHEQALLSGCFSDFHKLSRNDAQTALDLAFEYADAGLNQTAYDLLKRHLEHPLASCAVPNPLGRAQSTLYVMAWLLAKMGASPNETRDALARARSQSPDYFFPSRLHEQRALEWATAQEGADPVGSYALGNYYFDLKRHEDAIRVWERSASEGGDFATVHRNLGIAYWNVRHDGLRARAAYERAIAFDPNDARLVFEFDQLRKKLNEPIADRLAFLETNRRLVDQRDDATVELAALYNLVDQPRRALELLQARRFHPWEGGEGAVLRQYTTARIRLGQLDLEAGDAAAALEHFSLAMETPENLGESYHLLQAKADLNYWLGRAHRLLGNESEAQARFEASAAEGGDFAEMAVASHSPLSFYRGLSLRELGREDEAQTLFRDLLAYAQQRIGAAAQIDYFATSLPNILVFDDDLQARRDADNQLLAALAQFGLGNREAAATAVNEALRFSNANLRAVELARQLQPKAF